jgi:hypothetical protein
MKRCIVLSALWTVLLVLSWSAVAAAVDIVPYLGLKPGKWAILQNTNSITHQGYVTVQGTDGQIVQTWYDNKGSGWTFSSSEVFQITPTALLMIGSHDGRDLWIAEPVLTIPRSLSLNQPVYYTGIKRNQRTQATQRVTMVLVITKRRLTVDTQAGIFNNCIKFRSYQYSPGTSRDATVLLGPGRSELKGWVSKIKDTSNPVQETQSAFSYELIQFGDSNPPFP